MADGLATVFGGSGFIGRYVVQELAQHGFQVRVAVRRPDQALFLKTCGGVGQVTPFAAAATRPAPVACTASKRCGPDWNKIATRLTTTSASSTIFRRWR